MNQFSAVIEGMVKEYLPAPRGVEAPMSDLSRRTTFAQGITGGYIKGSGEILRVSTACPVQGDWIAAIGEKSDKDHYISSRPIFLTYEKTTSTTIADNPMFGTTIRVMDSK